MYTGAVFVGKENVNTLVFRTAFALGASECISLFPVLVQVFWMGRRI